MARAKSNTEKIYFYLAGKSFFGAAPSSHESQQTEISSQNLANARGKEDEKWHRA
jgi:hypothetical protein